MQDLVQFLTQEWMLFGAFILLAVLFLINERHAAKQRQEMLTPTELVSKINSSLTTILDCRPKADYAKGHINGAIHVANQDLTKVLELKTKWHNRTVVVIAPDARTYQRIKQQLTNKGVPTIFGLKGGIAAWVSEQLPLQKSAQHQS